MRNDLKILWQLAGMILAVEAPLALRPRFSAGLPFSDQFLI